MSMTMTELLAEVRDDIDEQTAVHWTNPQLIRYANEGLKRVARMSECLRAEVTKAIVAGTYEYTMSALTHDIVRFHAANFVRTGDTYEYWLRPRDLMNSVMDFGGGRRQVTGTPTQFFAWNNPPTLKLSLYPVPSDSGTLTLYYYRLPTLFNTDGSDNSDPLDIPEGWESLAVTYTRYRAFKFDGQVEQARLELEDFSDTLGALSAAATRFNDQPGQMVNVPHMGLPLWLVDEGFD